MGDPFKKARPGQPLEIPAEAYNAFVETALAHKRSQLSHTVGSQHAAPANTIKVRNETGQAVPRFGVIGLGEPIILPSTNLAEFQSQVAFRGTLPQPGKPFAITQEPIPAGAVGAVILTGTTPVRITVTEETLVTAGPTDAVNNLITAPNGPARILWKESGTGEKWAVVQLGVLPFGIVRFELITAISPGGAAVAKLRNPTGATEITLTVYDGLGIFTGMGGAKGYAAWMPDANRYEILQLEC